jgi:hypothetical protein
MGPSPRYGIIRSLSQFQPIAVTAPEACSNCGDPGETPADLGASMNPVNES